MSANPLQDAIKSARTSMDKVMDNTRKEFAAIRTGKATVQLLDLVRVEAYGNHVPLNQVGSVSAPEARLLTVQPWDKGLVGPIEKAIRESDLGLNPSTQGGVIRIPIPALTEERRKDLVKILHKLAEEGRVAVRHARHEALQQIKKQDKSAEDDRKHAEKDVQKVTDEHIKSIDDLVKTKEKEIMEV
jgi:ribosome recycling factor